MRVIGTILMLFGTFMLVAAALTLLGAHVRANDVALFATVTSMSGALIGGGVCVVLGAALRRLATRRRERSRPQA